MSEVSKQSLGDVLGGAECYLANMAELAKELQGVLVEQDGNIIKIDDYREVVAIVQVLWDKFKETAKECEGKEFEIKLGNDLVAMIVKTTLSVIGFNL